MSFEPVKNPVLLLPLEQPILFLGNTLREIALREPNAGDIFRCGNPVTSFDFETGDVIFDERKAFAMVSRLSNGIPVEGSLETMTSNDAMNLFHGIARFFIPGLRTRRPAATEQASLPRQDVPPAA